MFSIPSVILSFCAGILGTLIGGTQTFIITGFIGIIVACLHVFGVDTTYIDTMLLNTIFLPCVIFNGACLATAYASLHYPIRGESTSRSLTFCADPLILLIGGLAGTGGYIIYAFEKYFSIPIDAGAVSVLVIGVLGRVLFYQGQSYNQRGVLFLKKPQIKFWSFQLIMTLAISYICAYLVKETDLYTLGFSISALSLIFGLNDSAFPTTHHITIIVGYAIMQTGNIFIAVIFGVLAQLIFIVFGLIFNTDCGTHIDPPAAAIAPLSFILFAFF